jgi:hypothetical protein
MFVARYSGKSVCVLFHCRKNGEEKKTKKEEVKSIVNEELCSYFVGL